MELKLTMTTNEECKNVIFRKFFQIIFFNENKKNIDIYTAVILGANNCEGNIIYDEFINEIDSSFNLKFDFIVDKFKGKNTKVTSKDLTNEMYKQRDKLKLIWGNVSLNKQEYFALANCDKKIKEILQKYKNKRYCEHCKSKDKTCDNCLEKDCPKKTLKYPCKNCESFSLNSSARDKIKDMINDNNPYEILNIEGEKDDTISIPGSFSEEKNSFYLHINENKKCLFGIESYNWIHTKIEFDVIQDFSKTEYKLVLPKTKRVFTNDYTLYIGPPKGWEVDGPLSIFSISNNNSSNAFQRVGAFERFYFREWISECRVMDKRMSRVLLRDKLFSAENKIIPKVEDGNSKDLNKKPVEINLEITMNDVEGAERRNFVKAITISLCLAFGMDYTRMQNSMSFFLESSIESQWLLACICMFLCIQKRNSASIRYCFLKKDEIISKKTQEKREKCLNLIKIGSILLLIGWFGLFLLYTDFKMKGFFAYDFIVSLNNYKSVILLIVKLIYSCGIILSFLYIFIFYLEIVMLGSVFLCGIIGLIIFKFPYLFPLTLLIFLYYFFKDEFN